MSRKRRIDPFATPPANRAERDRADIKFGVLRIEVTDWSFTDGTGKVVAKGNKGRVITGPDDLADRLAAQLTADSN